MTEDSRALFLTVAEFAALKSGSKTVFKKVYDITFGLVKFTAKKCGASDEESDDVMQETYVQFFKKVSEIQNIEGIKKWLVVTARNRTIDFLRKRKKAPVSMDENSNIEHEIFIDEDYDPILREIEISLVHKLIEEISNTSGGEVFREFYIEGLKAREIAEKHGAAISTVTTKLSRLRKQFKEKLTEEIELARANYIS